MDGCKQLQTALSLRAQLTEATGHTVLVKLGLHNFDLEVCSQQLHAKGLVFLENRLCFHVHLGLQPLEQGTYARHILQHGPCRCTLVLGGLSALGHPIAGRGRRHVAG